MIDIEKLRKLAIEFPNITIAVDLSDLIEFHKAVISDTKRELEDVIILDKSEKYLTPKQVTEMLGCDLTTLWRWNKKKYLCPISVGGKRRYRMSDIKNILNN